MLITVLLYVIFKIDCSSSSKIIGPFSINRCPKYPIYTHDYP